MVERIGKSLYRAIYAEEPVSSRPIYAQRDVMPTLSPGIFAAAQGGAFRILLAVKAMAGGSYSSSMRQPSRLLTVARAV